MLDKQQSAEAKSWLLSEFREVVVSGQPIEQKEAAPGGRLIAVSNRTAAGAESRAGGLAVAVWDALVETEGLWVGWSGRIYDYPSQKFRPSHEDGVDFALVDMSKPDYEGFYLGYSNSVLWPVFHNRIDLAQFSGETFDLYRRINELFADGVADVAEEDDTIWVHDYHFLLLADALRERGRTGPIGFFLHIPFPPPDTFRAIPDHQVLGEGLLAYNVIGLQTTGDVENLAYYLQSEFGVQRVDEETFRHNGRTFIIRHCPIGIDADAFHAASKLESGRAAQKLETFLKDRDLVIGVDRMDYSKGLPQRFEGMAALFDRNPDIHGKVSFTQIAPPSRSSLEGYVDLREELDALCGRINGDYGDLDWIPIRYLARGYDRDEIAGLLRRSKVALVTPLQDGMNLVAKEFIAAQDPEDPGVLVLSQFAGAAEQMPEALIINPHDAIAIADAVEQALHMPLAERKARYEALRRVVWEENISWWRERFLSAFDRLTLAA